MSTEFDSWPVKGRIGRLGSGPSSFVFVHTDLHAWSDGGRSPVWWFYFSPSRFPEVESDFDFLPDDGSLWQLLQPMGVEWLTGKEADEIYQQHFGVLG